MAKNEESINADQPILIIPNRNQRDRIIEWMTIRQLEPGIKTSEVAKRIGLAPATLYSYITHARKEGWLQFDDPTSRIDYEIIPKVLDNLSAFLDQGDKSVTIETAKGTIFKTYQEAKGISEAPQTVLALKIESIGVDAPKVITGHVVGKPRQLTD